MIRTQKKPSIITTINTLPTTNSQNIAEKSDNDKQIVGFLGYKV
jgi:hypothetical protein